MKRDRVADLMTRDVTVIDRKSDVHELEKLLLKKRVHGLPVVDNAGALVGVISQTDLLNWHFNAGVDGASYYDAANRPPREEDPGLHLVDIRTAPIDEIMSPVVHCIGAERPIADAASTMIRQNIHRLVVVDEKMRVQGIISALDLLRAVPGVEQLVGPPRAAVPGAPVPRARRAPTADA